jgi:hypothetical protein
MLVLESLLQTASLWLKAAALVFSDVPLVSTTALTPVFADVLATVICFPAVAGIRTVIAGNHH